MLDSVEKTDHIFCNGIDCVLRYVPKAAFFPLPKLSPYNIQVGLLNNCVLFFIVLIMIIFCYLIIFL